MCASLMHSGLCTEFLSSCSHVCDPRVSLYFPSSGPIPCSACSCAVPGDKRQSALSALKDLQQSLKVAGKGAEVGSPGGLQRSPSMTKRKRSGPARASSAKNLKAEALA